MNVCLDNWIVSSEKRQNAWMDGWMDGGIGGWMDELTHSNGSTARRWRVRQSEDVWAGG